MANFGDFKGVFNTIISYLKSIDRNTRCIACAGVTPSVGTNTSVPAGASYLRVTKTNGTGTVTITFPDSTVVSLTTNGSVFEIPFTGALPAITIESGDGGTWTWLTLSK